jgi:hypothetical protein
LQLQLIYLGTFWPPSPLLAVVLLGSITLVLSWFFLPETKGSDLAVRDRAISFRADDERKREEAQEML